MGCDERGSRSDPRLAVVVLVAALQLLLSSTPDREFLAATLSLRADSLSNLCKVVSSDLLLEL